MTLHRSFSQGLWLLAVIFSFGTITCVAVAFRSGVLMAEDGATGGKPTNNLVISVLDHRGQPIDVEASKKASYIAYSWGKNNTITYYERSPESVDALLKHLDKEMSALPPEERTQFSASPNVVKSLALMKEGKAAEARQYWLTAGCALSGGLCSGTCDKPKKCTTTISGSTTTCECK